MTIPIARPRYDIAAAMIAVHELHIRGMKAAAIQDALIAMTHAPLTREQRAAAFGVSTAPTNKAVPYLPDLAASITRRGIAASSAWKDALASAIAANSSEPQHEADTAFWNAAGLHAY